MLSNTIYEDHDTFVMKTNWAKVSLLFLFGLTIFLLLSITIFWLFWPIFERSIHLNIFSSIVMVFIIPFLIGWAMLFYIFVLLAFGLILSGLSDAYIMLKDNGVILRLDSKGIFYHSQNGFQSFFKDWGKVDDIGQIRQNTKKIEYKYQVKFIDQTVYTFVGNSNFSTKMLSAKITEYWFKYQGNK